MTEPISVTGPFSLTIMGQGAGTTIIRRHSGTPLRSEERSVVSVATQGNLTLNGLTVTGGIPNIFCGREPCIGGGGIMNEGTLNIIDVKIAENEVCFNSGGGIDNSGTLNITRSTISNNEATFTDGGSIRNIGTVTITDSTMSNNEALRMDINTGSGGIGGGISNGGLMRIINSTIVGNKAVRGGGISSGSGLTIINTTIAENIADARVVQVRPVLVFGGGGIAGNPVLVNSIVGRNTVFFPPLFSLLLSV